MPHSTARPQSRKPHPDYPLTPRADGRWCKKIRGKLHIFAGSADEALAEYLRVKDALLAGREPRDKNDNGLSVSELYDRFLVAKEVQRQAGELTMRTWREYKRVADQIVKHLGKTR